MVKKVMKTVLGGLVLTMEDFNTLNEAGNGIAGIPHVGLKGIDELKSHIMSDQFDEIEKE